MKKVPKKEEAEGESADEFSKKLQQSKLRAEANEATLSQLPKGKVTPKEWEKRVDESVVGALLPKLRKQDWVPSAIKKEVDQLDSRTSSFHNPRAHS